MPMCPEAVFAMLAVARLGAIHSVVFGGFAAKELATRIQDCKPVVILTASVGLEPNKQIPYIPLLQSSLSHCSHKPHTTLVLQRSNFLIAPLNAEAGQRDWESEIERMERRNATVDCVPVPSSHPLYLLYTSGSTGTPKGVVRENGGHAVSLKWSMRNVMGIGQDDVYFAASDIGWVVGHSYSVYGPLLVGAATVIYEGKPVGTPDAGSFWRLIEEYKINVMFTAPTAVRAIKKEDPEGLHVRRYDISSLRSMLVAGERADPDT